MIELVTTIPGPGNKALSMISGKCKTIKPANLHAAFAFVSVAGVDAFHSHFSGLIKSALHEKFIYAGIGRGLTEPEALRQIAAWPNTKLYIYVAGGKISKSFILHGNLFHPKLIYVDEGMNGRGVFYSGSHNLTAAAFGQSARNVEGGAVVQLSPAQNMQFGTSVAVFLESIRKQSEICTDALVDKYADVRLPLLKSNAIPLEDLDDESDLISSAAYMFIEVGKASGMDRHQVEFNEFISRFFNKPSKKRIDLRLGKWTKKRPLTPKKTTFGVTIYRLGMPTIRMGAPKIQDRGIRFERTDDPLRFNYEVADINGTLWNKWLARANKNGQVGKTSRGRRYGFGF
jgi:hypothetical protein